MKFRRPAIIAGIAVPLVAAAGIAFAIDVQGGNVTGNIASNGSQPTLEWSNGAFVQCLAGDGSVDTTASGGLGIAYNQPTPNPTISLNLSNVYDGEQCSFTATVTNSGTTPIRIVGLNLSGISVSAFNVPNLTVEPIEGYSDTWLLQGGDSTEVDFTVQVPSNGATTTVVTGALATQ